MIEVEGTPVRVGTAGWRIPNELRGRFPDWGDRTQLWGYARGLDAVEINKTFYRLPMASTFEKWRERVPGGFRFALKAPRAVTHDRRLEEPDESLSEFLERASRLEERLGVLLFQLPPSLEFDRSVAERFLEELRERHPGPVAYFRLHGTPDVYRSPYRGGELDPWERRVRAAAGSADEVWCVFDNTAEGEGTADALALRRRLGT